MHFGAFPIISRPFVTFEKNQKIHIFFAPGTPLGAPGFYIEITIEKSIEFQQAPDRPPK